MGTIFVPTHSRVYVPVWSVFLSCLQDWPIVLSPVRGHCVCMMCVLAQTEHFHRISVAVESKMKRKAGGGQGKHLSGSYCMLSLTPHCLWRKKVFTEIPRWKCNDWRWPGYNWHALQTVGDVIMVWWMGLRSSGTHLFVFQLWQASSA